MSIENINNHKIDKIKEVNIEHENRKTMILKLRRTNLNVATVVDITHTSLNVQQKAKGATPVVKWITSVTYVDHSQHMTIMKFKVLIAIQLLEYSVKQKTEHLSVVNAKNIH